MHMRLISFSHPFDGWYRKKLQDLHGLDITQPHRSLLLEDGFAWSLDLHCNGMGWVLRKARIAYTFHLWSRVAIARRSCSVVSEACPVWRESDVPAKLPSAQVRLSAGFERRAAVVPIQALLLPHDPAADHRDQ